MTEQFAINLTAKEAKSRGIGRDRVCLKAELSQGQLRKAKLYLESALR